MNKIKYDIIIFYRKQYNQVSFKEWTHLLISESDNFIIWPKAIILVFQMTDSKREEEQMSPASDQGSS